MPDFLELPNALTEHHVRRGIERASRFFLTPWDKRSEFVRHAMSEFGPFGSGHEEEILMPGEAIISVCDPGHPLNIATLAMLDVPAAWDGELAVVEVVYQ